MTTAGIKDIVGDISALPSGSNPTGVYVKTNDGFYIQEVTGTRAFATKGELANHTGNTSNPHNVTKAQLSIENVDNTSDSQKVASGPIKNALDTKVDKITGKGLSTEDYTTTEKTKLGSIAAGAEVNVQSDWTQTSSNQDDYIKNKPLIKAGTGTDSIIEGNNSNIASSTNAHAEGYYTQATHIANHSEGYQTQANGTYGAHSEGQGTRAIGTSSHSEGYQTYAIGETAHAEGHSTRAIGQRSHAEGSSSYAYGAYSHAEGCQSSILGAFGESSHIEGYETQTGKHTSVQAYSLATLIWKDATSFLRSKGTNPDFEVNESIILTNCHTQETNTVISIEEVGNNYKYNLQNPVVSDVGFNFAIKGDGSSGPNAIHLYQNGTGEAAHAEGSATIAGGTYSHAEGRKSESSGNYSHAEGSETQANGTNSHAENAATIANGEASHAEGTGTIASSRHQHVQGKYNIEDANSIYIDIVGGGTSGARSNLSALGFDGTLHLKGDIYTNCANDSTGGNKLAKESSVTTITEKIPDAATSQNQLADKNFVNSSIATNTSNFLGTSDPNLTEQQFLTWANSLQNKTNNDYVFWNTTDSAGTVQFKRYKYNATTTTWVYEYTLNNSSFTSDQWAAIQSGVTSTLVTNTTSHLSNTSNPHSVTKAQVELGNVDNTSDLDKPISTATQTALNLKEDIANKVTSISAASTDTEYPTAKTIYNHVDKGYLPEARVGVADNLTDTTGVGTAAEFQFRTTAGDVSISDSGSANIQQIRGQSLKWRQRISSGSWKKNSLDEYTAIITYDETTGITKAEVGASTVSSGAKRSIIYRPSGLVTSRIGDHKIYISVDFKTNLIESESVRRFYLGLGTTTFSYNYCVSDPSSVWKHLCGIVQPTGTKAGYEKLQAYIGTATDSSTNCVVGDQFFVKNPQCFDLTEIFGAGNEPTAREFEAQYLNQLYEYSATPSIVSYTGGTIQTVGYNQCNFDREEQEIPNQDPGFEFTWDYNKYYSGVAVNGYVRSVYRPTNVSVSEHSLSFTTAFENGSSYGILYPKRVVSGQTYYINPGRTNLLTDSFQVIGFDSVGFLTGSITGTNNLYTIPTGVTTVGLWFGGSGNNTTVSFQNIDFHLKWSEQTPRAPLESYKSNTFTLPNVELRSIPAYTLDGTEYPEIYDTLTPSKLTRNIEKVAYTSGDEDNPAYLTDGTTYTLKPLDTPTVEDVQYSMSYLADDWGTEEFISNGDVSLPIQCTILYDINYAREINNLSTNYYNKTEIDSALSAKASSADVELKIDKNTTANNMWNGQRTTGKYTYQGAWQPTQANWFTTPLIHNTTAKKLYIAQSDNKTTYEMIITGWSSDGTTFTTGDTLLRNSSTYSIAEVPYSSSYEYFKISAYKKPDTSPVTDPDLYIRTTAEPLDYYNIENPIPLNKVMDIDLKQDTISDLTTIRSNASAVATKENKGKITINNTEYSVITSTTDSGTAGYITFVLN